MRVVFLGTSRFAVPSLQALLDQQYEVAGVVTQPDRPAGRGQKLTAAPVKRIAAQAGLAVFQPASLRNNREALHFLEEKRPELMVVAAFGQILPKGFFDYPPLGTLNVHASLLPRYRGASPVARALLCGETETGVTIMQIDEGMDTGHILTQRRLSIPENMAAGELEEVLAEEGARLLLETLPGYAAGAIRPQPQDPQRATYAPRLRKEEAEIDWSRRAAEVHNRVRAMNPWPGAFTLFRDQVLKIWRSEKSENPLPQSSQALSGTVMGIHQESVLVRCGENTSLALKEVQLPNRRRVRAGDFANGSRLKVGEILG